MLARYERRAGQRKERMLVGDLKYNARCQLATMTQSIVRIMDQQLPAEFKAGNNDFRINRSERLHLLQDDMN